MYVKFEVYMEREHHEAIMKGVIEVPKTKTRWYLSRAKSVQ